MVIFFPILKRFLLNQNQITNKAFIFNLEHVQYLKIGNLGVVVV